MLEKITYINHIGEKLEFGKNSLFANENELRDYAYEITEKNNKIAGFKKGIVSKAIPLIMKTQSDADGIELRNRVFEVFEKDVLTNQYGRFVIGDYYLKCYVTELSKADYLVSRQYITFNAVLNTDRPEWIKETPIYFRGGTVPGNEHLDFNYDFNYDFRNSVKAGEINNTGITPCNFKIVIYGATINPTIYIGNHAYSVKGEIKQGEFLTILSDGKTKTITLSKENGEKVNWFNNRDKESYIFEKIPVGVNSVAVTDENLNFDVVLLEERSEPKWI